MSESKISELNAPVGVHFGNEKNLTKEDDTKSDDKQVKETTEQVENKEIITNNESKKDEIVTSQEITADEEVKKEEITADEVKKEEIITTDEVTADDEVKQEEIETNEEAPTDKEIKKEQIISGEDIPTTNEEIKTEETDKKDEPVVVIQPIQPIIEADQATVTSSVTTDAFDHKQEETAAAVTPDVDQRSIEGNIALLHKLSSEYFLNKHSPSFKCLEQYLCSRSDLRLTLHFFPPLTDPGLDDALNYIPPEEEPEPNGCDKYINMCKYLNIVPIKRVIRSLATDTMDLKYYGLTHNQMRGIADALKVNSNIKYLILQDNWMKPESVSLIGEVLRESNSLRVLNLKECRIGEEGIEKLCEGISSTTFLQELDLSFNSLGDKGLQILQQSLIENTSIKKLDISHNNLTEESGATLEQLLLQNKTLEALDLSWNGFYTGPGNKKLCNGLTKNELISWLNLSWNGIGTGLAMRPITKYLRKTKALEFIDLSWNRITKRALHLLRGALIRNKSLNKVKIGNNIYTPDEAYSLATFFTRAKSDNIQYLDLEGMCVNKDFLQIKNQLRRKGKTINHGHVLSNYEIHGPNINKLLFARCKYLATKPKKKKKKKDFGHFVLSLPDKPITAQEFQDFLKKKKVKKIDKDLLKELLTRFPARHKKVDCVGMKEAYMELYPDTVLPEPKKKKKKRRKKHRKKKKKE